MADHSSGSDLMNEARAGGLDRSRHTQASSNDYFDMPGGVIWQVLVLAVAVVVAWRILLAQRKRPKKRLPNGPRPWPIVGNFPSLAGDLPHRALRNLAAKYGGLMFLRLGTPILTLLLNTYKSIFVHLRLSLVSN
jgi:hypothetical protein